MYFNNNFNNHRNPRHPSDSSPGANIILILTFFGSFILSIIVIGFTAEALIPGSSFLAFFLAVPVTMIITVLTQHKLDKNVTEEKARQQEKKIKQAGEKGEERVAYALSWLNDSYKVFNNLNLEPGRDIEKQQFDHLVVGPNGIFNIETKNWAAAKVLIDQYGNWRRIEQDGKETGIENPLFQTERHNTVLKSILGDKYPITDIVVIANNKCILEGLENLPEKLKLIKTDQLKYFIEHFAAERTIQDFDIREICRKIENCNQPVSD